MYKCFLFCFYLHISGTRGHIQDIPSTSFPLPLIIAVPAAVIVVVVIVVIFILQRRNSKNKQQKTIVRQRVPPPMPANDKHMEQYAALHAYHHNHMQPALSRERIIKNYSDFNSDVSQKMVPVPAPPPPPMQTFQNHNPQTFQNHNHMHTYAPC